VRTTPWLGEEEGEEEGGREERHREGGKRMGCRRAPKAWCEDAGGAAGAACAMYVWGGELGQGEEGGGGWAEGTREERGKTAPLPRAKILFVEVLLLLLLLPVLVL